MVIILIFLFLFLLWGTLGVPLGTFAFVLIIVVGVFSASNRTNEKENAVNKVFTEWKATEPFNSAISYTYQNTIYTYRVIFDEDQKKVLVFKDDAKPTIIPFEEIVGCEIRDNGQVSGGVGRAMIGGALAGGAGAIVGATTAKQKIISYQLVILRDSLSNPEIKYEILSKNLEIKRDSKDFYKAETFSNQICSAIKVILNRRPH